MDLTIVKKIQCSTCKKGFTTSGRLSRHECSHVEEKPFQCSFCQKTFSKSSNLTIHKRRHTGENHSSAHSVKKHLL